jgi:hypothetical protein
MLLKATGMAIVAIVLLGSSFAFGLFDSNYDLNGPYDQIYPAASPAGPAR